MNKKNTILALAVLAGSLFISIVGVANAQTFRTGTNVTLQRTDKIDQTLFLAGQNVDIAGEVNGDVFCAGQTVTISGTINGDVICAGQTVNITGQINGDVRLAGQTLTIDSNVKGNASVAGQAFTLSSAGSIDGDASIGSSTAVINGQVNRDLAVGSESLIVNSSIGRNLQAATKTLELSAGAKITGNIDYTSDNKLVTKKGATIGGEVTQTLPKKDTSASKTAVFGFSIMWFLYVLVALSLVSLVLAFLFPSLLKKVTEQAYPSPWKALLVGVAANIVVPVIIVITAITVVGIPLAGLIGISWLLILFLSGPFAGFYLGRKIVRSSNNVIITMLAGGGLLLVLYFIPIVGFIMLMLAGWLGSGMQLMALKAHAPERDYQLAEPTKSKKK